MKLAIFDFDGTLFPQQSIPFLIKCYRKMGYDLKAYILFWIKLVWLAFVYKVFRIHTKESFRKKAAVLFIQMFNGKRKDEIQLFFNDCIPLVIDQLNPKVVEEVKKAQKNGYYTILLSGCLSNVLMGVKQHLNMDYLIGTDLNLDSVINKFDENDFDIPMGLRKVERLLEEMRDSEVDWANSIAYGDSAYDESILKLVGKPIAVNPDVGLKNIAEINGWTILQV